MTPTVPAPLYLWKERANIERLRDAYSGSSMHMLYVSSEHMLYVLALVEQLAEALKKHGQHNASCAAWPAGEWRSLSGEIVRDLPCDCGLGTALSLVRPPEKEGR